MLPQLVGPEDTEWARELQRHGNQQEHPGTPRRDRGPPADNDLPAFALAGTDAAFALQLAQRRPQRHTANVQLFAKLLLGRQPLVPLGRLNAFPEDCGGLRDERCFLRQPVHHWISRGPSISTRMRGLHGAGVTFASMARIFLRGLADRSGRAYPSARISQPHTLPGCGPTIKRRQWDMNQ